MYSFEELAKKKNGMYSSFEEFANVYILDWFAKMYSHDRFAGRKE